MPPIPPHLKPSGRECFCSECGKLFTADSAFNSHRTGDFGSIGNPRRCRTDAELVADAGLKFDAEKSRWRSAAEMPAFRRKEPIGDESDGYGPTA